MRSTVLAGPFLAESFMVSEMYMYGHISSDVFAFQVHVRHEPCSICTWLLLSYTHIFRFWGVSSQRSRQGKQTSSFLSSQMSLLLFFFVLLFFFFSGFPFPPNPPSLPNFLSSSPVFSSFLSLSPPPHFSFPFPLPPSVLPCMFNLCNSLLWKLLSEADLSDLSLSDTLMPSPRDELVLSCLVTFGLLKRACCQCRDWNSLQCGVRVWVRCALNHNLKFPAGIAINEVLNLSTLQ